MPVTLIPPLIRLLTLFLLSSFSFLVRNPIHHYSSLISLDLNSSATCLSPKINWQVFRAPRVKHSFPQLSSFPPGDLIIQNFLQTRAQAEIIVSQLQWDHKRKFQHSKYSKYMNFWDPAKFIKIENNHNNYFLNKLHVAMAYKRNPTIELTITFRTCVTNEIDLLKKWLDIEKLIIYKQWEIGEASHVSKSIAIYVS